jgi:hypothetical protein
VADNSRVFDGSWGFRSYQSADQGNSYISISAGLWPNGNPAWAFHVYEAGLLNSFSGGDDGATIATAKPDYTWLTVLAALAHEAGHVRWAMTIRRSPSDPADLTTLHACVIDNSTTDFFFGWEYRRDPQLLPPYRWRGFARHGNSEGSNSVDHAFQPTLGQLQGGYPNVNLYQLYQAGEPWPSLFGAQTPDEDFVETYTMAVLTGYNAVTNNFAGPLTSLPLTIPGYSDGLNPGNYPGQWADVPRDLGNKIKPTLMAKMRCIAI